MQNLIDHLCSAVGEDKIRSAVAAFYRRIAVDDLLRPMYPGDDLGPAEERLADFLVGRFGGPQSYVEKRGHPRLRMRHAPFVVDQQARDRWVELMDASLAEVDFPEPACAAAREFLAGVATFLINR